MAYIIKFSIYIFYKKYQWSRNNFKLYFKNKLYFMWLKIN